eukprot:3931601-Rhodomonas_salina.2
MSTGIEGSIEDLTRHHHPRTAAERRAAERVEGVEGFEGFLNCAEGEGVRARAVRLEVKAGGHDGEHCCGLLVAWER